MQYRIISSDDHVTEPADLFVRRLSNTLQNRAPRVKQFNGEDRWVVGDKIVSPTGAARTNLKTPHEKRAPHPPATYQTCEPGIWRPEPRLKDYDADGIDAAVLFPDFFPGFAGNPFWSLGEDFELRLACIKAWNVWLIDEFCAVNRARLIPLCLLPAWSVEESIKELQRCAKKGCTGIIWGGVLDIFGLPTLFDSHWDPVWAAAQDANMVICMHQQSALLDRRTAARPNGWTADDRKNLPGLYEAMTTWHASSSIMPLVEVICSGMLQRFPQLKVFFGEAGVGWIPYAIEQADFFWKRNKSWDNSPLTMPPSHYWRRQCAAGFWYERIDSYIIDQLGEDNIMFEADYPHQITDNGINRGSQGYIDTSLARVTDAQVRHKALAGNAVRFFGLERYQQ